MKTEEVSSSLQRLWQEEGKPPSQIAIGCPHRDDPVYSGQDQVELVAAEHLTNRYRSAHSSPFVRGKMLDNVGHLGGGTTVASILDESYAYPPDYDNHAKAVCQAAAKIFDRTDEEDISIHITCKEFQEWWLTANEDIQLFKSGCHFSHYKAATENDYLLALHVACLNLALETGISYKRCRNGVMVLLEKEFGSIYIDKLRAICLFEANFNCCRKLSLQRE